MLLMYSPKAYHNAENNSEKNAITQYTRRAWICVVIKLAFSMAQLLVSSSKRCSYSRQKWNPADSEQSRNLNTDGILSKTTIKTFKIFYVSYILHRTHFTISLKSILNSEKLKEELLSFEEAQNLVDENLLYLIYH